MRMSRSLNLHLLWKSLGLAVNLFITILIARLLEASVSGQFFYFLSWMTLLLLIVSWSLDSSITYFIASKKISSQSLSVLSLIWIFFVICLLAIMSWITGDNIRLITGISADEAVLGLFFIAGQMLINYFTAIFYGEHTFVLPSKILFFTSILYVLFLLFISMTNNSQDSHYLIIHSYVWLVFLQGVCMMLAVFFSKKFKLLPFSVNPAPLKPLFVYSSMAFAANILFFLATRIDYWLLNYFKTEAVSVGNYIQISRLVQLFQLLPSMLAAFLFPVVASSREKMIPSLLFLCRLMLLLDLIFIAILGVFGEFIFPFVFGDTFSQMYELFILLIPGTIALSVLAVVSAYFAGINAVKINMLGSLFGLLIITALNVFLIPLYHVKAAAISSSIGYIICLFTSFYFLKRNFNIRFRDLYFIKMSDFKKIYTFIMHS